MQLKHPFRDFVCPFRPLFLATFAWYESLSGFWFLRGKSLSPSLVFGLVEEEEPRGYGDEEEFSSVSDELSEKL